MAPRSRSWRTRPVSPLDAAGPWDVAEVDDPAEGRVDLGGLLVRPRDGVELRLQADQASGALVSIMLAAHDGAVELRPFASAKDVDQWDLARAEIAEQFRRQGSTVTEGSGEYGTELHIGQPVDVQGKKMIQPVRMAGIRGPRWVLRADLLRDLRDRSRPGQRARRVRCATPWSCEAPGPSRPGRRSRCGFRPGWTSSHRSTGFTGHDLGCAPCQT